MSSEYYYLEFHLILLEYGGINSKPRTVFVGMTYIVFFMGGTIAQYHVDPPITIFYDQRATDLQPVPWLTLGKTLRRLLRNVRCTELLNLTQLRSARLGTIYSHL